MDGSDEHICETTKVQIRPPIAPPILVEFQATGGITTRSLLSGTNRVNMVCPETHFWCPDQDFCLPVFVRCNSVYDCLGHEDEEGCDLYTCPGYYRCRASKVCVHVTHVCDDWPLCPQLDDELLCGHSCPLQCTCQGLAFFCLQVFAADEYPDLRYLDARGSGMNVRQLGENHMLIHLGLSRCGVKNVSNFVFYNLHSLDLSDNLLTKVSGYHFRHMPQLTALFLAGNPLSSVFTVPSGTSFILQKTRILDLSHVKLSLVIPSLFVVLPSLKTLNLSHSGVDLFPRDVLRRFRHLQLLFTDNYKLCCPAVLRPGFDLSRCHTTPDDVSSCDNLLGSVTYRATVAVVATLSLLGNVVSLTVRVCVVRTWQLSSGGVVLTHLSVADLGTGLYLATLGLADRLLAVHYALRDHTWRKGIVCHLAGVLALSCRHAATFFITLLSLYRGLHWFPTLIPHLTPAKVKAVCVVVWSVSLLLATVPLISQWGFFGQQALCVPLPHIMEDSLESSYAHGVMVLLHVVLLTLCCVCEVLSKGFVKNTLLNKDTHSNDFRFAQLGSLASGFLYTIACLVPTDSHTERQKAAHTALVFFGSVASCATNPYLHLYGVRAERSKRIKEERILKIVNSTRV